MSAHASGNIVTFYSYKGGVGRTFTLANVASLLVHWGYRVLCVDWDIEAPGLHYYFPLKKPVERGLYELVKDVRNGEFKSWRKYVYSVNIPRSGRRIDVIYASSEQEDQVFDPVGWEQLYEKSDLGGALERIRDTWKREYDFVFIDSRTGVTDAGAICTVQLPDILVFLLTANDQSLKGSVQVVRKAIKARQKLPVERSALRTVPIVCRFDGREEYELTLRWKSKLKDSLLEYYSAWVSNKGVAGEILELTTIPYIPRWSFGEEVVGRQEQDAPDYISYYFINLAALLANRLERADSLLDARESYVRSARTQAVAISQFSYDVFISSATDWVNLSSEVGALLKAGGFRVFDPQSDPRKRRDIGEQINDGLAKSRNLVLIAGESIDIEQINQLTVFFRDALMGDLNRRVLPVWMSKNAPSNVPAMLRNFRRIPGFGSSSQLIAGNIAASIASKESPYSEFE